MAELALEELSPFPLESLAWGFVRAPGEERLFLYAAYRERLRQSGATPESWGRETQVFPDFLPALLLGGDKVAATRFYYHDGSLIAVLFDEDRALPEAILTEAIEAQAPASELTDTSVEEAPEPEVTAGQLAAARARLSGQVDASRFPVEAGYFFLREEILGRKDGGCAFRLGHAAGEAEVLERKPNDDAPAPVVELGSDEALWRADLRTPDFKARERRERRLAGSLWVASVAAVAVAGLFLVLEVALLGFGFAVDGRLDKQTARNEEVKAFQARKADLEQMKQFSGSNFEPFQFLRVLEAPRPEDLYFRNAYLERPDRARIQARFLQGSGSIALTDRYIKELEATGLFESLEPEPSVRGPDVLLDLRATFKTDEQALRQLSYRPAAPSRQGEPGGTGSGAEESSEATAMLPTMSIPEEPVN